MFALAQLSQDGSLVGVRVAVVGKLAGMPKREAQQLLRSQGAVVAEKLDPATTLAVVGEADLPLGDLGELLDDDARRRAEEGTLTLITETELWQHLGFVEGEQNVHRLYTPAMLADLLGVPVAIIRRWHRRGLIQPSRQVRKLPYFDFQEVATARRLAELLAAGMSPATIEKKLAQLTRLLPGVARPLAQLSVIVEGKNLLLRQGDGLIEPGGQLRFDFETGQAESAAIDPADSLATLSIESGLPLRKPIEQSPEQLRQLAAELEDAGELERAVEAHRACLAAGGPQAEVCFQLAELLYRLGDVAAARERYYMAIELDEDYVEARANLGCVLAETGCQELARAAFEGALRYHPDYPDAHYHLARILDGLGTLDEADAHWQAFLALAPDSPWAVHARERLLRRV
jgi:DNA-binding transcriptional MerR regulator